METTGMEEIPVSKRPALTRAIVRRPSRVAILAFMGAILLGAILLALPWSAADGRSVGVVDAFFTSTSAVCVTGLVVRDTPREWSLFGQLVILALVQAGGLGIMTVYAMLALMLRARLSLRFERMVSDTVEPSPEQNLGHTVKFICLFALIAEVLGAISLFFAWRDDFPGFWSCLYSSVFHSVSAFCNAGFSLFSDSLVRYRGEASVCLIMCSLIVVGGLGFVVVREILGFIGWHLFVRRGKRPRLSTHTSLVFAVTAALLVVGFVGIFMAESLVSLKGEPLRERVLAAAFQSVTARTAGFNTIALGPTVIAPSTALLLMVLMFIGGSPGSTAGGIKTTTVGVMLTSILATLRGRERAEMFHHSIPNETVHKVSSVIVLSVTVVVLGAFALLVTERNMLGHFGFLEVVFETVSAFGTVGLSMGLTPQLSVWGRLIIMVLMFVGRLGPVTLMLSAAEPEPPASYKYPDGDVMVG
jgi:trk system potassium uptake protein TrkH